jgi:hypothetical protein
MELGSQTTGAHSGWTRLVSPATQRRHADASSVSWAAKPVARVSRGGEMRAFLRRPLWTFTRDTGYGLCFQSAQADFAAAGP